jgi:hypothetical protein
MVKQFCNGGILQAAIYTRLLKLKVRPVSLEMYHYIIIPLNRIALLALGIPMLVACGKPLPEMENIDLESFKKDKNACGLYRTTVLHSIDLQKDKVLGLDERQIIELFGNPDRNELYKRNQKFYYYYLQPSADCPASTGANTTRLVIRFNAMGLAKEALLE